MDTRVKVYGRSAFVKVNQPERFQGTGKPRYSASIIMEPDSKGVAKIKKAMKAAAADKWGEKKADSMVNGLFKSNKVALIDGDTKPDVQGFPGNMVIQAHAQENNPPTLVQSVDGENVKLDNATQNVIYSGCYVNAIIEIWAQDNQWGKRLNASLAGLQFVAHGEPFSGGRPASSDDFDVIEDDDNDDDDDMF